MSQKRLQKKTLRGLKEKRKSLLEEGTIRRFMKLAEIEPLTETFFDSENNLEEKEEKLEEMGPDGAMHEDDLEAGVPPEVDMEADVEVEDEPGEEGGEEEVLLSDADAQVILDLADKLRAAGAGTAEGELGAEEELPVDDEAGLPVEEPVEDEEELALEEKKEDLDEDKEDLEEKKEDLEEKKEDLDEDKEDLDEDKDNNDLVSEIAKRVAARILLEK